MLGTVSFYKRTKGWGFIVPDDLGPDLFLHCSHLPADHRFVNEGDRVEFEVGPIDRNRPIALNVRIVEEVRAATFVNSLEARHVSSK